MANTIEEFAQLEPLWDKAIESSAQISLEEKHKLLEWPPLAVMQASAQKYLGKSVENIIHKAATEPRSLTYSECRLIKDNFRILKTLDRLKYHSDRKKWVRARPDLQAKMEQAHAAVLLPEESKALQNLQDVFYNIQTAHYDMNEAKRRQQKPAHLPPEWVQNIIDQGDNKSWGYMFYYHKGQEGWQEFRKQFDNILAMQMFTIVGEDQIIDSKVAEFVEFEAKEKGKLDFLRE